MDDEYQKLDDDNAEAQEQQEFEGEEYYDIDINNHEHGHACQCGSKVGLLAVCALANIVTAIFTIIIVTVLVVNTVTSQKANDRAERKAKSHQRPQMEAIFEKDGMSYEQAMKEGKPMVVLFYADWCPHCRNFAPTFTKLSKDRGLSKKFNFVRINSESPESKIKMKEFKVEGFPALYLVNPKTKEQVFITNNLLFGESAKENLKEIFLEFANK